MKPLKAYPSNVYLIRILNAVAYMPVDNYTQWATKGPGDRFYINRRGRGCISISSKRVEILAQQVVYLES